jgi:hypothetical protein
MPPPPPPPPRVSVPLPQLLSTLYFRTFCDKFAGSFLPAYLALLLRQRRINEMGTQQVICPKLRM